MTGVIFDLDGTLVSTNRLHLKAWIDMFEAHKIVLTKEELQEQAGMKCVAFINIVLQRRGISNLNPQKLTDEKDEFVIKSLKENPAETYEGVKDFLKLLKATGIRIALATSGTKKTATVLARSIIDYFDAKIFADDVTKGKPDPEVFLKAAEKIRLKTSECIVFEDATTGIKAAKDGCFLCVAYDNGSNQDLSSADLIIKNYNPQELIKLFI